MLMFNIQKQKNFGTIIRSAAAFGIDEVFLVGTNHKKMTTFGSQGTANKTNYRIFD
jgi:tRNA G18 (ribose-2'-O)-methylase SpoU